MQRMQQHDQKVIASFKSLLEQKVSLCQITLFGSRARGDADPDSDMDLLVVVDSLDPVAEKTVSACAWEIGFHYGVVIVPIVYSRDEWEKGPERFSLLAKAVERDGVSV